MGDIMEPKEPEAREAIEIEGASSNNLKHISVKIPKEKLVMFAGVSGSGKSSLAFDTVAAESGRQWQASYPMFLRQRLPRYERPEVENIRNLTPSIVVDQKPIGANVRSTVGTAVDVAPLVRLLFSRVGQPSAGGSMAYSFNHPHGMCPECTGLGEKAELDESLMFDRIRPSTRARSGSASSSAAAGRIFIINSIRSTVRTRSCATSRKRNGRHCGSARTSRW